MVPEAQQMLEMAVLGCAMIEPEAAVQVTSELEEKHFAVESHRDIFRMVRLMLEEGKTVDMLTLSLRLNGSTGGIKYFSQCVNAVSSTLLVDRYIAEVRRLWTLREIRERLMKLSPQASREEVEDIMQLIQERDVGSGLPLVKSTEVLHPYLDELAQGRSKKTLVKTGFQTVEKVFFAQPGDLVTIAARTGVGKTALMTNMLKNMVLSGTTCLYIPTEMRPGQFMGRVLPMLSGVPAYKFRAFSLTGEEIRKVSTVGAPKLYDAMPFYMLDRASPTIQEISKAVKLSECKAVFVDYLGRCSMPKDHSRPREIERFMVSLKNECVRQGVTCFLGVQLSRRTDYDNSAPKLADLSDSSAIEKESDAVIFMWVPKEKNPSDLPKNKRMIEVFFGKNRFGYPAIFDIELDRDFMEMWEVPKKGETHDCIDACH